MRKVLILLSLTLLVASLAVGTAMAVTYTLPDNIVNFPGYENIGHDQDQIGTPAVEDMIITVSDDGYLQTVEIEVASRRTWDSLLINVDSDAWHEWDYMVRDTTSADSYAGTSNVDSGLYSVNDFTYNSSSDNDYTLSTATGGRDGHPNGIVASELTWYNDAANTSLNPFIPTVGSGNPEGTDGGTIVYDFSALQNKIYVGNSFLIAYAMWCANDVSAAPVPEPATMMLGGLGLLGMGIYLRRRTRKV